MVELTYGRYGAVRCWWRLYWWRCAGFRAKQQRAAPTRPVCEQAGVTTPAATMPTAAAASRLQHRRKVS